MAQPRDISATAHHTAVTPMPAVKVQPNMEAHDERINTMGSANIFSKPANYAAATGITSIRLALEYPFWTTRVTMQSNPSQYPLVLGTMKSIFKERGMQGFYPGAGPYFVSNVLKQAYRLPAISLLPGYFHSWVPDHWESHYGLPHVAAASSIAVAETLVFGPVERLARYKMGNQTVKSMNLRFLYTGVGPALAQSLLAWNLFANLENFGQTQLKQALDKKQLNAPENFGVGLFVGMGMTLCNLPLDALQSFSQTRPASDTRKLFPAFAEHVKKHGAKTFVAGWRAALLQGVIGSTTMVFALDMLRNQDNGGSTQDSNLNNEALVPSQKPKF